jgi:uncharacterized protein
MSKAERLGTKVFLFVIVTGLMNYYVLSKLFLLFNLERDIMFYTIVSVFTVSYLLGAELLRMFNGIFVKTFSAIFSTWLGVSFTFLWMFAILDLLTWIFHLNFAVFGYVVLFGVLILTIYSIYNATTFSIRTIKVESEKLSKSLKIVQLSDLHIGATHKKNFLSKSVSIVNDINPDFVVLTGDLLDGVHYYAGNEFECLSNIKCPVFFVLGNHEQFLDMDKVDSLLKNTNMSILRNKSVIHEGIQIIGIDDTPSKAKFVEAFNNIKIDVGRFTLLLYHRPNVYKEVAKSDVDLMLSGHTHGGQLFPINLIMYLIDGPVKGIHKQKDLITYISTGTGWWGPPMRLGSRNEITIIELEAVPLDVKNNKTPIEDQNNFKKTLFAPSVFNFAKIISLRRAFRFFKKKKTK